jgi:ribonuclease VapC
VIVDTSAIVAILRREPDADRYGDALAVAARPLISAGTYLEAAVVVDANGDPVLSGRFDDLLAVARVEVVPVTERHAEIARHAHRSFGKGSGHPAGLNFGDCFSYALSRVTGQPLLYKGNEFTQTERLTGPPSWLTYRVPFRRPIAACSASAASSGVGAVPPRWAGIHQAPSPAARSG